MSHPKVENRMSRKHVNRVHCSQERDPVSDQVRLRLVGIRYNSPPVSGGVPRDWAMFPGTGHSRTEPERNVTSGFASNRLVDDEQWQVESRVA
jgi:hypothetical protein